MRLNYGEETKVKRQAAVVPTGLKPLMLLSFLSIPNLVLMHRRISPILPPVAQQMEQSRNSSATATRTTSPTNSSNGTPYRNNRMQTDVTIKNNRTAVNKDIVMMVKNFREDRLGSNIQFPLFLMAFAHCRNVHFCILPKMHGVSGYFPGFLNQTCTEEDSSKQYLDLERVFEDSPLEPGIYSFGHGKADPLMDWMKNHQNEECAFDDAMRRKWGQMILDACYDNPRNTNTTLAQEELFEEMDDPKSVTVAINIRRGDFVDWRRKVATDQSYVGLLRRLRSILQKAGRVPEVHLFSEDYGLVDRERNITCNWTLYDGLVEHFHLAPEMRTAEDPHAMDLDLNIRDWCHFIKADILVTGGSFSRIPALGRPRHPDPETGLPLTIHFSETIPNTTTYKFGWTKYDYGPLPDQMELLNLPQIFAQHDTIPTEHFMKDLMADWNATYNNNQRRKYN